jgi:hypothetical protein
MHHITSYAQLHNVRSITWGPIRNPAYGLYTRSLLIVIDPLYREQVPPAHELTLYAPAPERLYLPGETDVPVEEDSELESEPEYGEPVGVGS